MARPLHLVTLALVLAAMPAGSRTLVPSSVTSSGGPTLAAEEARHLLARTGVGPSRAEIGALRPLTRAQAVDRVVASLRTTPPSTPSFVAGGVDEAIGEMVRQRARRGARR